MSLHFVINTNLGTDLTIVSCSIAVPYANNPASHCVACHLADLCAQGYYDGADVKFVQNQTVLLLAGTSEAPPSSSFTLISTPFLLGANALTVCAAKKATTNENELVSVLERDEKGFPPAASLVNPTPAASSPPQTAAGVAFFLIKPLGKDCPASSMGIYITVTPEATAQFAAAVVAGKAVCVGSVLKATSSCSSNEGDNDEKERCSPQPVSESLPAVLKKVGQSLTSSASSSSLSLQVYLYRPNPCLTFSTTLGKFSIELLFPLSPQLCSNVLDLAQGGFYNGLHVHRVAAGFVAQFGCPLSKDPASRQAGQGSPQPNSEYPFIDTCSLLNSDYFNQAIPTPNDQMKKNNCRNASGKVLDEFSSFLSNLQFTISMANSGQPNTSGSQFFINLSDNTKLDWFNTSTTSRHPVFAIVVDGFDVIQKMSSVKVNKQEAPTTPIKVEKVEVSP